MNDALSKLRGASETLYRRLREGHGYEEEYARDLLDSLNACLVEWKEASFLPKDLVRIVSGLPAYLHYCADSYQGTDAQEINSLAFRVLGQIEAALNTP